MIKYKISIKGLDNQKQMFYYMIKHKNISNMRLQKTLKER